MKMRIPSILSVSIGSWTIAAILGLLTSSAPADSPRSEAGNKSIIYFLRHCEDSPELVNADPSYTVVFNNCANGCCVEVLNPLGKMRAAALAEWFEEKKITDTLTDVIASHKCRTRQTVEKIAQAAGLGGDLDGDGTLDGYDVDQVPGDGVMNVPNFPAECDPGWTSSSSVKQPQIDYISSLPLGSRAVVCTHSPVMYPLMQAFGIDTSDPVKFPQDAKGRVRGFNNLWIVEMTLVKNGATYKWQGRLLEHVLLDLKVDISFIDRDHGSAQSQEAADREE